jgi:hypothetical protein
MKKKDCLFFKTNLTLNLKKALKHGGRDARSAILKVNDGEVRKSIICLKKIIE